MATFAWMTDEDTLAVTTCVDGVDTRQEADELKRRGQIPRNAEIVFNPVIPNAPSHQMTVQNGQVIVDPRRPAPFDRRADMIERTRAATTIDQLRQVILDVLQQP